MGWKLVRYLNLSISGGVCAGWLNAYRLKIIASAQPPIFDTLGKCQMRAVAQSRGQRVLGLPPFSFSP